ncbi:MAG: glycoside hydrolase family 38 C-terminal domain-containing protein, partial [Bacilli bacterium]
MKYYNVIAHTHWDLEWYRSYEAFLHRLVYTIDQIIETLENDPSFTSFVLDGQVCILEDYLSIRPLMKTRIKQLVSSKRLLIGPWYTQPDLNIVNGESLIRNLLIGSKYAQTFGYAMPLGWIPDAFGQIQATPQLFKSFGFDGLYVWRGFDYDMISDSYFKWESANGEIIDCIHFGVGYGYYRYLPANQEQRFKDYQLILDHMEERYKSGQFLMMQGSD